VRPDGTRVSAIVAAASLDRQARGVAIILDVTARKTALAALCASEERFRKLIENSYDSVLIMDAGSSVTFTSPATSRILGYDPAEIVGMRLFDIIHPDDLACARSEIHALLANPATTSRAKVRCRAKDGSWHQLETVGRNFFDDPSIAGIVLNSRDLSAA
jgi:PAS domain S-box-containing protein